MMKIKTLFQLFAFTILGLASCNDPIDKKVGVEENMRIPVSINDSVNLSIDKSPMDMNYYPVDYPMLKMGNPNAKAPLARVIYSRPQKKGRVIFADTTVHQNYIQHYGEPWRLGANECTEIEFFTPAKIGNNTIAAGRYSMYCIPYPDRWKIIFNNNINCWGLDIDQSKDIGFIEIPVNFNKANIEFFTLLFKDTTVGCTLEMSWGDMKVSMPIQFNN